MQALVGWIFQVVKGAQEDPADRRNPVFGQSAGTVTGNIEDLDVVHSYKFKELIHGRIFEIGFAILNAVFPGICAARRLHVSEKCSTVAIPDIFYCSWIVRRGIIFHQAEFFKR